MVGHKDGKVEPRSKAKHDPRAAFEIHKKARQEMHPRFSQEESSRRPTRTTRGAPQYRESGDGSNPSSNDDDTKDYRVENRKRKSTDRESNENSTDDEEEEIEEEEEAPLVQHPPQGGQSAHSMHFGMLEVHSTKIPNYVARVNYKAKGMTKRAREQRRIDPRSQPESCPYDHRFRTMF